MKKIMLILLNLSLISNMFTTINAEEIIMNAQENSIQEYKEYLQEKVQLEEDIPMPIDKIYQEEWEKATTEILEEKNSGYRIVKIITDENSTTFIFEPISIEKILRLEIKNNSNSVTRTIDNNLGYLASVKYTSAVSGVQTKIEKWYNAENLQVLSNSGIIKNINAAASVILTVLSFSSGGVGTTATALSLIQTCLSFGGGTVNKTSKYQVITHVENVYKTKQAWAYNGKAWVIGAQVQRQEQYRYTYTYEKDPQSNVTKKTYVKQNKPNNTLSNWDSYREKSYYNNDSWLTNRAVLVSKGTASVYQSLYKVYTSGKKF